MPHFKLFHASEVGGLLIKAKEWIFRIYKHYRKKPSGFKYRDNQLLTIIEASIAPMLDKIERSSKKLVNIMHRIPVNARTLVTWAVNML